MGTELAPFAASQSRRRFVRWLPSLRHGLALSNPCTQQNPREGNPSPNYGPFKSVRQILHPSRFSGIWSWLTYFGYTLQYGFLPPSRHGTASSSWTCQRSWLGRPCRDRTTRKAGGGEPDFTVLLLVHHPGSFCRCLCALSSCVAPPSPALSFLPSYQRAPLGGSPVDVCVWAAVGDLPGLHRLHLGRGGEEEEGALGCLLSRSGFPLTLVGFGPPPPPGQS